MKYAQKSFLMLLLALLSLNCRRDIPCTPNPVVVVTDTLPACIYIPTPRFAQYGEQNSDTFLYSSPRFLRNSNTEFVVNKQQYYLPPTSDLLRYNLDTKTQEVIANNVTNVGEFEVNDEFVFYSQISTNQLYQVSLNGNGKRVFNNDNSPFSRCVMFNDGKKIAAYHRDNYNTYIYDIATGQLLSGFPYFDCIAQTISQDSLFAGTVIFRDSTDGYKLHEGVKIYNYITQKSRLVFNRVRDTSGTSTAMYCMKWHPNKRDIYFVQNYSIYRLNTQTQTLTTIKASCDVRVLKSLGFVSFDISADGTKMLAAVYSATVATTPWPLLDYKYQIWLFDINGNVIKRVL
jgi:hypothetical protein